MVSWGAILPWKFLRSLPGCRRTISTKEGHFWWRGVPSDAQGPYSCWRGSSSSSIAAAQPHLPHSGLYMEEQCSQPILTSVFPQATNGYWTRQRYKNNCKGRVWAYEVDRSSAKSGLWGWRCAYPRVRSKGVPANWSQQPESSGLRPTSVFYPMSILWFYDCQLRLFFFLR